VWDIINVVVLYWEFKTGSGLCKWWVQCTLLFLHEACIRFICCVPSDKGCGGRSCMLGLETLYSTWVPDQDETPHIFILNRAMGLYCRGCRQFCLYILCWRAHYRRKVKNVCLVFWLVPKFFIVYICPCRVGIHLILFSSLKLLLPCCWVWQKYRFQCASVDYVLE